jgi:hypothetical protein
MKERDAISLVTNIFTTPRHIFLVYRTARNNNDLTFGYRLQTYTTEGDYISDVLIPGNPGPEMWFGKENYELYAISEKSGNDNSKFTILKYKINR